MEIIVTVLFLPLIILSLFRKRWAYIATIVLGILFFFARVNFHLTPTACQTVFDIPLALYSLGNYKHVILFAIFFLMTRRQIHKTGLAGFGWASLATLTFGLVVELLEGLTGDGNCRLRDLVPDFAGVLLGQAIFTVWSIIDMKLKSKHKPNN
jgi:surface polysaccharide O-acyltransferase-like enzyme